MPEESRVAVVTGSSTGIGAALARRLAARGMRLGLIALPGTGLEAVAAAIRQSGGSAIAIEADVTDREASSSALSRIADELGPIDLLVLNAGIGGPSPVILTGDDAGPPALSFSDRVERFVQVNIMAAVYAIDAVVPGMIERGRGHVVGTSSLASYRGQPFFTGYCGSKAGLAVLLEGLRIELKPQGIDVTIVRPGFVKTAMTPDVSDRVMIGAEEAASWIERGILGRHREVVFPTSAAIVMSLVRSLPNAVYDRLASSLFFKKSAGKRVARDFKREPRQESVAP